VIACSASGIDCRILSDGRGGIPPSLFDDVAADELAAALGTGAQPVDAPYGCLLVQAKDATVLVDTGLGAARHPFGGTGGALWGELERAAVSPADVDIVVVSHGHLDHIGGLTRNGRPAFPRARYVIAAGEWSHWTSPDVLDGLSELSATPAREQLPPLAEAGVVEQISGEVEIADGVRLVPAPGHTAAHLAVEVGESNGLLYAADALLHPLHVAHPDWGRGADADPGKAAVTRRALLERASARGHALAASHWDAIVDPVT
jgi:glyoxylase-like metal-dependent hydrolase (beta-lactamase superfamily II)